ncbi:MAG: aminodeoxychorismate lyase [Pseudomonadota bacterium]
MSTTSGRFLINGQRSDMIAADDRGLLYGDGLFETVAFVQGSAPLWSLHRQRLLHSMERMALPAANTQQLLQECRELAGCEARSVIRITVTRGCGGTAYFPPEAPSVNRILMRRSMPNAIASIDMIEPSLRLEPNSVLAGIKHLNRIEQVLIAQQCLQQGVREALVCDRDGWIVEGLSSNLVLEQGDALIAPGPHPAAVHGVGLRWLQQALGDRLQLRPMHRSELAASDSIWVINSVAGIRPVASLDGEPRPIGRALRQPQRAWHQLFECD